MTHIYLIRHSMKMRGPVCGDFSMFDRMQPLSVEGEERAQKLLDISELRHADFAMASTMSRSLATIRYILEEDHVPYVIDDRLREMDFGRKPEDVPMDEFMRKKWDDLTLVPEGGESVLQCRGRMQEAILEAVRQHPNQTILVGSHGAAIAAYLSGIRDDVNDDFVRSINLPDVFHLTFDGDNVIACERIKVPFPLPEREPNKLGWQSHE